MNNMNIQNQIQYLQNVIWNQNQAYADSISQANWRIWNLQHSPVVATRLSSFQERKSGDTCELWIRKENGHREMQIADAFISDVDVYKYEPVWKVPTIIILTWDLGGQKQEVLIMDSDLESAKKCISKILLSLPIKISHERDSKTKVLLYDYTIQKIAEAQVTPLPIRTTWYKTDENKRLLYVMQSEMIELQKEIMRIGRGNIEIPVFEEKFKKDSLNVGTDTMLVQYMKEIFGKETKNGVALLILQQVDVLLQVFEEAGFAWPVAVTICAERTIQKKIAETFCTAFGTSIVVESLDMEEEDIDRHLLKFQNSVALFSVPVAQTAYRNAKIKQKKQHISELLGGVKAKFTTLQDERVEEKIMCLPIFLESTGDTGFSGEQALRLHIQGEFLYELPISLFVEVKLAFVEFVKENADIIWEFVEKRCQEYFLRNSDYTYQSSQILSVIFNTVFEIWKMFCTHNSVNLDGQFLENTTFQSLLDELLYDNEALDETDGLSQIFASNILKLCREDKVCFYSINVGENDFDKAVFFDERFTYFRREIMEKFLEDLNLPGISVNQIVSALRNDGFLLTGKTRTYTRKKIFPTPYGMKRCTVYMVKRELFGDEGDMLMWEV